MDDALEQAKLRLQTLLFRREQPVFQPLIADRWVANSLLQKSIRRREVEVAQRAALTFLEQGGSAIWRRFIIIAFEDVGAVSPEVVALTVSACTDAGRRKRLGGNALVATCLARILAEAPKSRSAEHLITSSDQHPSFEQERRLVSVSPIAENLDTVADSSKSITHRALAGWCASGIGWKRDKVSGNDLPGLLDVFLRLGVSKELVVATGIAAATSREPITLMVPLVWLAAHDGQVPTMADEHVPRSIVIDAVPMYALDKHTRTGREAICGVVKSNAGIQECLERYVVRSQWNDAAYMAAFYADAAPLVGKLAWKGADRLEALGTEADLLNAGVPHNGIEPMLRAFRENTDQLNQIRADTLRRKGGSLGMTTGIMTDAEGRG